MDSNHDKVIQSHLVHDGCAIVATFSGSRAASLPICPTGPLSSQLIEAKQFRVGDVRVLEKSAVKLRDF
jgi:hypothetical protein